MTDRFTIEAHEKRMRELLKPKSPIVGDMLTRFKDVAKKKKISGTVPPLKPDIKQET